jgi:lipopolysaccharide/colanic/teichoic acid biosynthesis glycosyltransferase
MHVLEDGDQVAQASRDDARVTRAGGFLRQTSLDELPQLLNVIRGEMSLVGPRPHAIAHDRHYGAIIRDYRARQSVKPGITGWAQVNGFRGETPTVDIMRGRIECDVWYARHCSVLLDLKILLLTVGVVLNRRNAY